MENKEIDHNAEAANSDNAAMAKADNKTATARNILPALNLKNCVDKMRGAISQPDLSVETATAMLRESQEQVLQQATRINQLRSVVDQHQKVLETVGNVADHGDVIYGNLMEEHKELRQTYQATHTKYLAALANRNKLKETFSEFSGKILLRMITAKTNETVIFNVNTEEHSYEVTARGLKSFISGKSGLEAVSLAQYKQDAEGVAYSDEYRSALFMVTAYGLFIDGELVFE